MKKEKVHKKRCQQKNTKKELVLVFDENARREFLTGFHKRKVQRKTKAAEELEKRLKLERKKIKAQTKQMYDNLIKSQQPIPDVSELLTEEIDLGEHCVSVTEISAAAAAKRQNWIGENQVKYHQENENGADKRIIGIEKDEIIEGMDIAQGKAEIKNIKMKTKKDFKKIIKKEATEHVKKSKVFKTKSRVAQIKNKKRKRREEWRRAKQNKNGKKSKNKRK